VPQNHHHFLDLPENRATRALPFHDSPFSLHAPLAHVKGTVAHVFEAPENHHGADHQHFTIKIEEVIDLKAAPFAPDTLVGQFVFIAVRFGDGMGLQNPIPGLSEDTPIEIQGEYISAAEAYPTEDNDSQPPLPVLHFTHHPMGFLVYGGQKYS
jgi:hypothetical protein